MEAAWFKKVKEHPWTPVGFFFGGFIFDVLLLHRPDTLLQVLHQALYLTLLTLLLACGILEDYALFEVPEKYKRYWKYHAHLTQFLLGTLLNVYAFFYFKSSSLLVSIGFMFLVAGLLVANEFVKIPRHQTLLKLVLYFLCLTSFWLYIIPMLVGYIGLVSFILALVVSNGFIWALYGLINRMSEKRAVPLEVKRSIQRKLLGSGYGVLTAFLLFYLLQIIPPIPLSLKYIGIFHEISKENGEFVVKYSRPWWRFWERGDQTFYARPGDSINAYVQVFAPRGFRDQLFVRWQLRGTHGWQKVDLIPISVSGGREEGFRGYTVKSNYQPGEYRVQIETTDGREVGRISLEVIADVETTEREWHVDRH